MSKGKARGAEVIELPDELPDDDDATTFTLKHADHGGRRKSVETLTLRDPELRQLKGIKIPTERPGFRPRGDRPAWSPWSPISRRPRLSQIRVS